MESICESNWFRYDKCPFLKQYNDKNPNGYTKDIADKIVKDKRYLDANKAMKEKQKSGNLKDEYTGRT